LWGWVKSEIYNKGDTRGRIDAVIFDDSARIKKSEGQLKQQMIFAQE